MFYCKQCQQERKWPESLAISFGPCELCGNTAKCYDVKSCHLPLPHPTDEDICGKYQDLIDEATLMTEPEGERE